MKTSDMIKELCNKKNRKLQEQVAHFPNQAE